MFCLGLGLGCSARVQGSKAVLTLRKKLSLMLKTSAGLTKPARYRSVMSQTGSKWSVWSQRLGCDPKGKTSTVVCFQPAPGGLVKIKVELTALPCSMFVSCVYLTRRSRCHSRAGCSYHCSWRVSRLTLPGLGKEQVGWR